VRTDDWGKEKRHPTPPIKGLPELPPGPGGKKAVLFGCLLLSWVALHIERGTIERGLPESLLPLLQLLSLHEGYVALDYLETMAKFVRGGWSRVHIDQLLNAFAGAGLATDLGNGIYCAEFSVN
jgi:hypothetical protein